MNININGTEGMTIEDIELELDKGGRFVVFQYCISILIMTFRRVSDIYFIKAGEFTFGLSIKYTLVSLLFGWWGIPWGPIYTIGAIFSNLFGGKDVTYQLMESYYVSIEHLDEPADKFTNEKSNTSSTSDALNKFTQRINEENLDKSAEEYFKHGIDFMKKLEFDDAILEFVRVIRISSPQETIYQSAKKQLEEMGFSEADISHI